MNTKTYWKRLLSDHRHTAVGFLLGLTGTLFVCFLHGSDARLSVPRGVQVQTPASLVVIDTALHPAPEESPAGAEPSSSTSSESSVDSSAQSQPAVTPQPVPVPDVAPVSSSVRTVPRSAESVRSDAASSSSVSSVGEALPPPSSSSAVSVRGSSSSSSSSLAASSTSSAPSTPASSSSVSSAASSAPSDGFPPFLRTVSIVSRIPNWGAMRTPAEWNRSYSEMTDADFVPVPSYVMKKLTVPMKELTDPITADTIPEITRKLFYSTRYFGAYDLDSGEFTAVHPGVDLKLARGTPVGSIAGGLVREVSTSDNLGLHVIIEHHIDGEAYYSIYGHFDSVSVSEGQAVTPGQTIGRVGMTGHTSAPHVHLQIDHGMPGEVRHEPYLPSSVPSGVEAAKHVVNPMVFIGAHGSGQ